MARSITRGRTTIADNVFINNGHVLKAKESNEDICFTRTKNRSVKELSANIRQK